MLSDKTQCLISEVKRIALQYLSQEEVDLLLLLSSSLIDQIVNDADIPDNLKCHQIQIIASSAVYQARSSGHVVDEIQLNNELDEKIKNFFELASNKWKKSTQDLATPTETVDQLAEQPVSGIEVDDPQDTLVEVIMAPENVSFFLRVVRVVGDALLKLLASLTKPKKKKNKKKKEKKEPEPEPKA